MCFFKTYGLWGILVLLHSLGTAQPGELAHLYETASHSKVARYQFDQRYESLVLASSFSMEDIRRIPFTDRRIVKIDLVYTDFSESPDFSQRNLDIARLQRLVEINPQVIINKFFDWNIIGQTGCASSAACLDFFHGFVIYYEEYFTRETSLREIDSIKSEILDLDHRIQELRDLLKVDYRRIGCEYPESLYSSEYLSEQLEKIYKCDEAFKGRVFFDVDLDYNGRPLNVNVRGNLFPCKEKLAFALKYIFKWKRGLVIGRKQYDVRAKGYVSFPLKKESVEITGFEIPKPLMEEYQMLQQYSQCVAYEMDTSYLEIIPKIDKKVVSEVLFRNKWDPGLIIVDVTGSMYPFTADLLKWLKLTNDGKDRDYVFFNDGDDKPTAQKNIGRTGGLYYIETNDFAEVRDRMFEAMRAGGGGDLPENNIEALIYGTKQARPTDEVVMIADNYAFPRDHQLLAAYEGPLKIILCHTEKGINTEYLNLARKHGFTLHTLKSDIINLQQQKTGEQMTVEGKVYRLTSPGYVRVR